MESTKEESKEEEKVDVVIRPIFPNIEATREKNTLVLETYLRKKHRGVWYLWKFYRRAYAPEGTEDFSGAISGFCRDIYMAQMFGKIDPKMRYRPTTEFPEGELIFPLSSNQDQTEKERMDPKRFYKTEEHEQTN